MEQLKQITPEAFVFLKATYCLEEIISIRNEIIYHLKVTEALKIIAEYKEREERKIKLQKLKTPLDELDLSIVAKSLFRELHVNCCLADIVSYSFTSILAIDGINQNAIDSIEKVVQQYDLTFDMSNDELVNLVIKEKWEKIKKKQLEKQEEKNSNDFISFIKNNFAEEAISEFGSQLSDYILKEEKSMEEEKKLVEEVKKQKESQKTEEKNKEILKKQIKILTLSVRQFVMLNTSSKFNDFDKVFYEKKLAEVVTLSKSDFISGVGRVGEASLTAFIKQLTEYKLDFGMNNDDVCIVEAKKLLEENRLRKINLSDEHKILALMKSISEFGFISRISRILQTNGFRNFLDIVTYNDYFENITGIGPQTSTDIEKHIDDEGLELRMSTNSPLIIEAKRRLRRFN